MCSILIKRKADIISRLSTKNIFLQISFIKLKITEKESFLFSRTKFKYFRISYPILSSRQMRTVGGFVASLVAIMAHNLLVERVLLQALENSEIIIFNI